MSKFKIELRDRNLVKVDEIDAEALDVSWTYSRNGGCGGFSFRLPRRLFEEKNISGLYNIQIHYRNPATNSYDLWYQGLIQNKTPYVAGHTEDIQIDGHGYYAQLKNVYVTETYASTEVSAIVTDILDNYIVPNTDITYDAGDIEATGYTPDSITFNDYGDLAIQKLADIVGTREYGVDKDRKFFFKARSTTEGRQFYLRQVEGFTENQDFTEIVNRIFIQGAQSGGTSYISSAYSDLNSQSKYGTITDVISNSSVSTDDVASQLATAKLSEVSEVIRKCSFRLVDFEAQIEATNPIDLVSVIKKQARYGQKRFGQGLYSGKVFRTVNRIDYILTNSNTLEVTIDCGQLRPDIVENISQLNYNLEQERASSLA